MKRAFPKGPAEEFTAQLGVRTATGALTGGISPAMMVGDFGQGASMGAWTAAYATMFNDSTHYWKTVWDYCRLTNQSVPGVTAPVGLGLCTDFKVVTPAIDDIGIFKWIGSGFRGATLGGATFTAAETGVIAAGTVAMNFALPTVAWEGGVFIGSLASAGIMELTE